MPGGGAVVGEIRPVDILVIDGKPSIACVTGRRNCLDCSATNGCPRNAAGASLGIDEPIHEPARHLHSSCGALLRRNHSDCTARLWKRAYICCDASIVISGEIDRGVVDIETWNTQRMNCCEQLRRAAGLGDSLNGSGDVTGPVNVILIEREAGR